MGRVCAIKLPVGFDSNFRVLPPLCILFLDVRCCASQGLQKGDGYLFWKGPDHAVSAGVVLHPHETIVLYSSAKSASLLAMRESTDLRLTGQGLNAVSKK